ncbi:MAG: peptidylprolyl isomerase [Gammaproteobacteria bacterium]|nr:peptidylprolyl isomerase [Gammaproteobacteria bacterium]
MTEVIKHGSKVNLHLRLKLKDGKEFDSTFDDEPLTLVLGGGELVEPLEFLLMGLKAGDHETYDVSADQEVFGYYDEDLVHDIDLIDFPEAMQVDVGTVYGFTTPAGDDVPGVVQSIQDNKASVDFNHPLIGHDFDFEIKILDVERSKDLE